MLIEKKNMRQKHNKRIEFWSEFGYGIAENDS